MIGDKYNIMGGGSVEIRRNAYRPGSHYFLEFRRGKSNKWGEAVRKEDVWDVLTEYGVYEMALQKTDLRKIA